MAGMPKFGVPAWFSGVRNPLPPLTGTLLPCRCRVDLANAFRSQTPDNDVLLWQPHLAALPANFVQERTEAKPDQWSRHIGIVGKCLTAYDIEGRNFNLISTTKEGCKIFWTYVSQSKTLMLYALSISRNDLTVHVLKQKLHYIEVGRWEMGSRRGPMVA